MVSGNCVWAERCWESWGVFGGWDCSSLWHEQCFDQTGYTGYTSDTGMQPECRCEVVWSRVKSDIVWQFSTALFSVNLAAGKFVCNFFLFVPLYFRMSTVCHCSCSDPRGAYNGGLMNSDHVVCCGKLQVTSKFCWTTAPVSTQLWLFKVRSLNRWQFDWSTLL